MTDTPADGLRIQAVSLIDKYFDCHLSPEHNTLIFDLMQLFNAHERALLDSLLEQKQTYQSGHFETSVEAVNIEVIQAKRKELYE